MLILESQAEFNARRLDKQRRAWHDVPGVGVPVQSRAPSTPQKLVAHHTEEHKVHKLGGITPPRDTRSQAQRAFEERKSMKVQMMSPMEPMVETDLERQWRNLPPHARPPFEVFESQYYGYPPAFDVEEAQMRLSDLQMMPLAPPESPYYPVQRPNPLSSMGSEIRPHPSLASSRHPTSRHPQVSLAKAAGLHQEPRSTRPRDNHNRGSAPSFTIGSLPSAAAYSREPAPRDWPTQEPASPYLPYGDTNMSNRGYGGEFTSGFPSRRY